MSTTYPLATLAPTVSAAGISAPAYNDILQSLYASFKAIYGSDIYIAPDSQDGQWIAVIAQAIHDANSAAVAVFQSFSPAFAQGAGLSSLVQINGISRNVASYSTAVGTVIGQAGTVITNGTVSDAAGNLWNLPANVTIPTSGSINVTVTAQQAGAITAVIGQISNIVNPQIGWQSFTNIQPAVPGNAVETDAALRVRQYQSTAYPALTLRESIYSAVANVAGVTACTVIDNDTGMLSADGIPAHSIAVVVQGGDSAAIAAAIALKKPPGAQTYGDTSVLVYDSYGIPVRINFFILQQVPVYFVVTIRALQGYTAAVGVAIQNALAAYVNGLTAGVDVYLSQAQGVASLVGTAAGSTFYITGFQVDAVNPPLSTGNLSIAFNQTAVCTASNVAIVVT